MLSALTGLLLFGASIDNFTLCAQDEKTLGVCLRNWVSSVANLAVAVVAVAAAGFAFKQWKASDRQAASAALPFLVDRLRSIEQFHTITRNIEAEIAQFSNSVAQLHGMLCEDGNIEVVQAKCRSTEARFITVEEHITRLILTSKDIKIDNDIGLIASEVQQAANFKTFNHSLNIYTAIRDNSNSRNILTTDYGAYYRLKGNLMFFERCLIDLRLRRERLSFYARKYEQLADVIKTRKLSIMGVAPTEEAVR